MKCKPGRHMWMPHPSMDEKRYIWCGNCGAEGFRFPGDGIDEKIAKRDARKAREAWLQGAVEGVVQEWLPGYTEQFKIVAVEPEGFYRLDPIDPETGVVAAGGGRLYKVTVTVEEGK